MSLPTPPSTTHHRDKEVRLPGCRVAWAQQNQYYILSQSPLALGRHPYKSCPEQPAKSILKKRDHAFLLPPDEDQREITPEPDDPLINLTYLSRPVEQIIAPEPTLRDLIEAYSILHARLRATVSGSTDTDETWPLFRPLRKNKQAFTNAVIRDLDRAFVEPKTNTVEEDELPLDCVQECEDIDMPSLLPSPKQSPKKKKQGMSASQIKFARDLCTTTHAVLRLLSAIFTMEPLYQLFDDAQLRDMLSHVLAIPMADELPTPNARKTCALSIWLLQVQRLPETVLLPARDRIAYALRRGMEGELGKEGKKGSACDGLKAVHDLSFYQPTTFIPAFVGLLPSILANLLAPTLGLRVQACHALGGFVLGCVALPPSDIHACISNVVSTFLTAPPSASPRRTPSKPTVESAIIRTLRMTLNTVDPQHVAQGPVWSLSVLAAFIVLLGPKLCTNVRLTRIVSALLSLAMRNKKSSVRAMATLLWRCVTWVYVRPPLEACSEDEEVLGSAEEQDVELARENYWKVVKSVVDMGAGVSSVAGLLGDDCDDEDRVKKALSLVKVMVGKGGQTALDAIDITKTLVSPEPNTNSWSLNSLLPRSLFSSNPGLLTADYKTLSAAVKPIFDECPQLSDIRPLTREQLSREWVFNVLVDIWRIALSCLQTSSDSVIPSELLLTWKDLMKANVAALLDSDDHEGVVEFAARTAGILIEILRDPRLDLTSTTSPPPSKTGPGSHSETPKAYKPSNSAMKLSVVRELWGCMRATFPSNLLHAGSARLLECLIEDECDLVWEADSIDGTRKEWAKLCCEALVVCDVDELEKFWAKRSYSLTSVAYEPGAQSLVWSCFVETWQADQEASWEGATILLGAPFDNRSAWELSNDEFTMWDAFLKHATNKANDHGIDAIAVLDQVASVVARSPCPAFASSTRVADLLLSHCDMDEIRDLPSHVFEFVNDTLVSTYPPEPRNMKPSIWLVASLTRAVDTCPVDFRLALLETIQDGVSTWLSDECCVFTRDDYSFDVLPLYQTALLGLQELPRSVIVLETLSPLLQSVFVGRDDKPDMAREAFNEFWSTTYADSEEPAGGWPNDLRICFRPIGEVHDDFEPSSDPEDEEDSIAYGSSHSSDVLLRSPSSSPIPSGLGSRCSNQALQSSEDWRASSPFIGRLGPALFTSQADSGQPSVSPIRARSPSPDVVCTEPSTPISAKPPLRASTPPRPHKPITTPEPFQSLLLKPPAGTLPIHPTTPTTPRRSPFKVPSSVSPSKKRSLGDKENVSPLPVLSVMERICSASPSSRKPASILGKRPMSDDSPRDGAVKRGRTSFIRSSIEFPSSGDSDLEDEMAVEASLSSPPRKVLALPHQSAVPELSQSATISRKRKRRCLVMDAVVVPSLANLRRQRIMQRRASADLVKAATPPPDLRRSSSMPKLRDSDLDETATLQRKRMKHWDDVNSELPASSPALKVLEETIIAGSDDSIMLVESIGKVSESQGSDDDPHLGQVSPRHLASPAPRRRMDPDYDPPSDDAPSSSPSRDLVARRQQRFGSTVQRYRAVCR